MFHRRETFVSRWAHAVLSGVQATGRTPPTDARPSGGAGQRPARYWFGRKICRNFSVLMSRNIGVPGGSSDGVRKSVSKL